MRLGTCIALELVAAGAAIAGVWLAASKGSDLAGSYLHGREAAAATATYTPAIEPAPTVVPLERARLVVAPPVVDT
ncbi:MAG: hypothetical protein ACRDMZ_12680, partial [Solirubrobacteraceae bacterium]